MIPTRHPPAKFLIVWFGQLVSIIGSGLTSFGLGIWVYQSTGSVSRFALISICFTLPAILVAPAAGVLVDRTSRRRVMIISDVAAGMSTLALAILFFTGHLGLWEICILVCIESVADAFRLPSYTAMISLLVPGQHIARASGMMQFGPAAAQVLAPALAAVLISAIRLEGVLLVDFLTFIFALATLLVINVPELPDARSRTSLLKGAAEGWKFITARPGLVALLCFFFFINLTNSFVQVLLPPIVLAFASVKTLGTILSAGSMGYLGGSILMSAWGGPRKRVHGLLGSAVIYALGIVLAALAPSPSLITIAAFIVFFHVPVMNTCSQAIWLLQTPMRLQGRVFSTRMMLAWSSIPVAAFLAGPLADRVFEPLLAVHGPLAESWISFIGTGRGRGTALLLILNGALSLLIAVACCFNRHLRGLDGGSQASISYEQDMAPV
jgi:DHA3 family macrolide efflux protein-like MFS transporter